MRSLTHKDLLLALNAARELHDAVETPEAFQLQAMNLIARLVPSGFVSINDISRSGQLLGAVHNREDLQSTVVTVLPSLLANLPNHPLWNYFAATGEGDPRRVSDFTPKRGWERGDFFNEFYRPLGGRHQASMMVEGEDQVLVSVTLLREDRDFSERELELLKILRPHIAQAFRHAKARAANAIVHHNMAAPAGVSSSSFLVADQQGRILFVTPQAEQLLAAFGCPVANRRIPDAVRNWCALVTGRIVRFGQTTSPAPHYEIRIPNQTLQFRCALRSGLYNLALTVKASSSPSVASIEQRLTRRELEVLRWLAEGKSDREISMILSSEKPVSIRTIEAHVRNLLAKLGLENRRLAMRVFLEQQVSHGLSFA